MAGVILTFAPAIQAEATFRYHQFVGQQFYVQGDLPKIANQKSGASLLISEPPPLAISPLDPNADIIIPKIGANAKIIPNVDPGNETEYLTALKEGVALAAGTVNPGQPGNAYIFAHSVGNFWEVSRWNAVFYLLRELTPGDEVDIFWEGKRYLYRVYDQKIVNPEDIQYLTSQSDFPMLTLQTCWPPGTTFKRLLVFARLASQ